jgi:hypothetical protein
VTQSLIENLRGIARAADSDMNAFEASLTLLAPTLEALWTGKVTLTPANQVDLPRLTAAIQGSTCTGLPLQPVELVSVTKPTNLPPWMDETVYRKALEESLCLGNVFTNFIGLPCRRNNLADQIYRTIRWECHNAIQERGTIAFPGLPIWFSKMMSLTSAEHLASAAFTDFHGNESFDYIVSLMPGVVVWGNQGHEPYRWLVLCG